MGKEIGDTLIMNAMHTIELGIRMNSAMIIVGYDGFIYLRLEH